MSSINQGQQQETAAPVNSIDAIAELLLGENDDADSSNDDNDGNDDESPLSTSTDQQVVEGEKDANAESSDDDDITWAKALGVNEDDIVLDDDGNLKGIKVGDDSITLSELKNGYQFNKANTQRSQQLAEERKQFEQVKQSVTTEYTQKLQNVHKLTELLADRFLGEYNSVDWQRLRAEKPGEYAALLRDFDARKLELQNIFSAVDTEQNALSMDKTKEQQEAFVKHLEVQAKQVIDKNPEWSDINKFKSAMSDMTSFIGEAYGFSQEEFNSVYDARLIELIKDAMAYRKGTQIAKQNLAKAAPKFQKSTGQVNKVTKLDSLVKKAKAAKGYQKKGAEVDAVAALLLGVK